jgi:hypothetical protein
MNNKSLESSSSTMLMPHETDGSIVGHHNYNDQMHHGSSFYHTVNVFNSFHNHNSFQDSYPVNTSYSNLSNNMSTSIPPLIHQEAFYTSNRSNIKDEPAETSSISHQTELENKEEEIVPEEEKVCWNGKTVLLAFIYSSIYSFSRTICRLNLK